MKQDPKQVASKQAYEIKYIANKFGAPMKVVRQVVKEVGKSRRKVYAKLKELGYKIRSKEFYQPGE